MCVCESISALHWASRRRLRRPMCVTCGAVAAHGVILRHVAINYSSPIPRLSTRRISKCKNDVLCMYMAGRL